MAKTFEAAREAYANRAQISSPHTLSAYLRGIDLFIEWQGNRELASLGADDLQLLRNFAHWLATERTYASSTIELRLAGLQRWFEFLEGEGWLPDVFPLAAAKLTLREQLPKTEADEKSVQLSIDLAPLLRFYDTQKPPRSVQKNPQRLQIWELTRLRNAALIKMLAETGGQVSVILGINVAAFVTRDKVLEMNVVGKSNHRYTLHLRDCLPAIYQYLDKRDIPAESAKRAPLFVSHDPRHQGSRMSRVIAWRIIQRAAKGVGLPQVSPHDLRHWRAQQLIADGATLEDVKTQLGHRSLHTVRNFYGHMVDE